MFARASRSSRFLRYLTQEALAGRGTQLKESLIGVEVFDKPAGYDTSLDSTVRTEATKLRSKLREYYAGLGAADDVVIEIPKGSYVPAFGRPPTPSSAVGPKTDPTPQGRGRSLLVFGAIAGVVLTLLFAESFGWIRTALAPRVEPEVVAFTTTPEDEYPPSLSPDGTKAAYAAGDEKSGLVNVFVKPASGGAPARIGSGTSSDSAPCWSPDGEQIAFVRTSNGRSSIILWVYRTGAEKRLADVGDVRSIAWSPDGQSLVISERSSFGTPHSLHLISVQSAERKRLTWYSGIGFGDVDPAWSSDGKWIAFVRWEAAPAADLYIVPSGAGDPVQLTRERTSMFGVSWIPGEDELLFGADREGMQTIWRATVKFSPLGLRGPILDGTPKRVPEAGDYANYPSLARTKNGACVLAFQRLVRDFNVWSAQPPQGNASAGRVVRSTRWDFTPDLSPDGKRLAFASDRSGNMEIWISGADGSNPRQLTNAPGFYSRVPKWSPDGRWIAFDSRGQGMHGDILLADTQSGKIRHLTTSPVNEVRPFWSADGEWVYFRSDQGGLETIWKVRKDGGAAVQVLKSPVYEAMESLDGSSLYFTKRSGDGLWRMRLPDGVPSLVSPDVRANCWALTKVGVFYFSQDNPSPVSWRLPGHRILLLREGAPRPELVVSTDEVLGPDSPLITATHNGDQIAWAQADTYIDDLVLVRNFR